jgi:hypothetical protein
VNRGAWVRALAIPADMTLRPADCYETGDNY